MLVTNLISTEASDIVDMSFATSIVEQVRGTLIYWCVALSYTVECPKALLNDLGVGKVGSIVISYRSVKST